MWCQSLGREPRCEETEILVSVHVAHLATSGRAADALSLLPQGQIRREVSAAMTPGDTDVRRDVAVVHQKDGHAVGRNLLLPDHRRRVVAVPAIERSIRATQFVSKAVGKRPSEGRAAGTVMCLCDKACTDKGQGRVGLRMQMS